MGKPVIKRLGTVVAILVVAIASVPSALASVDGQIKCPQAILSKEASHPMPQVGETLVFTLRFAMVQGCYTPAQARISDPNPAPSYLDILTPTIAGGAWYSPSIDGVVWEDMLIAGDEYEISYQVRVLGLPEQTPDTGYRITNTATIADLNKPGTLPLQSAHAVIQLGAPRALLPVVLRSDEE